MVWNLKVTNLTNLFFSCFLKAENEKNKTLIKEISQVLENIKSLETEGLITKSDDYATLLRDVALEVVNREEVRESQRTEIKRLKQTLRNLQKHQKYLKDQIKEYEDYLAEVRLKQYAPKKKKKTKPGENPSKQGPFKFSYRYVWKRKKRNGTFKFNVLCLILL